MDAADGGVLSSTLTVLPQQSARRGRKAREVPPAPVAVTPAVAPAVAPPIQPAPEMVPPPAPSAQVPYPAEPPRAAPVAQPPVAQPPVAQPPVAQPAAPQAAPGVQALQEAFAIDIAERDNRFRAHVHAMQQAFNADVTGREERHAAQVQAFQQAFDAMRAQLAQAVADRDKYVQAHAAAHEQATRLSEQSAALDAATQQLRNTIAEQRAAREKVSGERDAAWQRCAELEAELHAVSFQPDRVEEPAQSAAPVDEAATTEPEASEPRPTALDQLREAVAEQRAELESLRHERDGAWHRFAELEAELGEQRADRALMKDHRDAARQQAAELESDLAKRQAELDAVTAERDSARRRAAALEADVKRSLSEPSDGDHATTTSAYGWTTDPIAESPKAYGAIPAFDEALPADIKVSPDHPVSVAAEIELDAWQRDAIEAWTEDEHRGVIEAIAGAGEARVAHWAIGQAIDEGRKVLVVVPSADDVTQWYRDLREALPINRVAKLNGNKDPRLSTYDVVVTTASSAAKENIFASPFHGLLVAVDTHSYGTRELSPALDASYAWRLGLTTSYARDDDGIATYLDPYFGGVSFRLGYERALADEVITPFEISLVAVQLSDAEQAEYDAADRQVRELTTDESRAPGRGYQKAVARRDELLANTTARDSVLRALAPTIRYADGTAVFAHTQPAGAHAARVLDGQGCATTPLAIPGERDVCLIAGTRATDDDTAPDVDLAITLGVSPSTRQSIQRLGQVIAAKQGDRPGRLVVVYVEGTIEEGLVSDEAPFIAMVAPHAASLKRFSGADTDELLERLTPSGWPITVPIATAMAHSL